MKREEKNRQTRRRILEGALAEFGRQGYGGSSVNSLCAAQGIPVSAIPGPCAVVTALSVSGLPTGRFTFEGFLSTAKRSRQEHLEMLRGERRTMIFYEAPHKLRATLADLCAAFGDDRPVSLCRELTKLHEEVRKTTLGQAQAWYAENEPRGEYVLVMAGAPAQQAAAGETLAAVTAHARALMEQEGMPASAAAREAARGTPFAKSQVYRALMADPAESEENET